MGLISTSSIGKMVGGKLFGGKSGGGGGGLGSIGGMMSSVGGRNLASIGSVVSSGNPLNAAGGLISGSKYGSYLSTAQSSIGDLASGQGDISNALGTIGLGGAGKAVGGALSGAENFAGNMLGSATSEVSSLLGSGVNEIESGIGSIAGGIGDKIGGLFGSSSDKSASKMNKKTPDPLKTSTVKGTPQSKTFTLSNQYAQSQPVDLQNKQPAVSDGASSKDTLLSRFGAAADSTESGIMGMAKDLTHNSIISGITNTVGGAIGEVQDVAGGVVNTVGGVVGKASGVVNDFTKQYAGFFQGLSGTQQSLSDLVENGLPQTADANGNPIDGVPSNVGSDQLNALYGAAKSIGCSIQDRPYTKYAAEQSFKSALLGITSKLNMKDALHQMTNCEKFQDGVSINRLSHIFTKHAASQPGIANVASKAVNDPSRTPIDDNLAKQMVTNPDHQDSDNSDIIDMFHQMNVPSSSPYGINTGGTTPVYDSDTISAASPALTNQVLGNHEVSDVIGGNILGLA